MTKKLIGLGILAMVLIFGMTVVGCDDDPNNGNGNGSSGKITITGLGAYNGRYIAGIEGGIIDDDDIVLVAFSTLNSNAQTFTGGKINNGSASLNVWQWWMEDDEEFMSPFNGNGLGGFALFVYENSVISFSDVESDGSEFVGFVVINLVNGEGSGQLTLDSPWDD
jgi:hypothetical protein